MNKHSREKKVLLILGISITLGALVLNSLGYNPPSAGAFCLSRYYLLGPVEKSIVSRAKQFPERWNKIEVDYSGTDSGNIEQLNELNTWNSPEHLNYHFIICNGNGGHDGLIQPTENWQSQSSITPGHNHNNEQVFGVTSTKKTIYICVIADNETSFPTNFQITRTGELVGVLCRKFNIKTESISYPDDWQ